MEFVWNIFGFHYYKPELIVIRQRMFMQIEILPNITKEIEFQILYIYSANTIITLYYTYCMYVCIVFLHTIVVYTFVLSSYLLGCPQSFFRFIRKQYTHSVFLFYISLLNYART